MQCRLALPTTTNTRACRATARSRPPTLRASCSAGRGEGLGSPLDLPLDLPGGAGVWLGSSTASYVTGTNYGFVMLSRERPGREGLVRRPPAAPKPLHVRQQQPAKQPLMTQRPAQGPQGLSLVSLGVAGWTVIDTDFEVVQEAPEIVPNTTCTGIIPVSLLTAEAEAAEEQSRHPRRTLKVRFTCNMCGASSERATNPHAWQRGSVFMRCEGCGVVHKMRDNLKIFHELRGPVFPPRHMRDSFLVQEVLDRIQASKEAQRQQRRRRRQEQGPQAGPEGGLLN